jgi:hypothetical protein
MLRRVILSSVGAKNSGSYYSKTLSANFEIEVRQYSLHLYFNCGVAGLTVPMKGFVRRPGKSLTEPRTGFTAKSLDKSVNPNSDLKGFVARPGKSVSTTGRDLCQEFFMVN